MAKLTDAQIVSRYAGIRDQDGFETLELTLIEDLGKVEAARAMKLLSEGRSEELEFPHHTREEQDEYDHRGEEFETNADVE